MTGSIDYLDECPACGMSLDEKRLDVHLHQDHSPGDFGEPVVGIDAEELDEKIRKGEVVVA